MKTITLACDNIIATAATQVRAELNKDMIEQYTEDIKTGAIMPPIDVFAEEGSEAYFMADGFHRHRSAINAGEIEIECNLHVGGLHEALVFALGANSKHGMRRTNADKVNAVKLALKDPVLSKLTQQEIADVCCVHINTVQRVATKFADTPKVDGTEENSEGESEENTPENNRPTKAEPTQNEIERWELRHALALIKAFPYGGEDSTKLHLEPADIEDLEYVSGWCAHGVLAHNNGARND